MPPSTLDLDRATAGSRAALLLRVREPGRLLSTHDGLHLDESVTALAQDRVNCSAELRRALSRVPVPMGIVGVGARLAKLLEPAFVAELDRIRDEGGLAFERCCKPLLHKLNRFLSCAGDDAGDLLGKVLALAWRDMGGRKTAWEAWLMHIAANRLRDWFREQRQKAATDPAAAEGLDALPGSGNDDPASEAERQELLALTDLLPSVLAESLRLFAQGYSDREISERMGVGRNTVRSRLNRARAMLRSRLGVLPPPDTEQPPESSDTPAQDENDDDQQN